MKKAIALSIFAMSIPLAFADGICGPGMHLGPGPLGEPIHCVPDDDVKSPNQPPPTNIKPNVNYIGVIPSYLK